jgi:hypothetical protein
MNHRLWTMAAARVLAMSFLIAGAAACGDRTNTSSNATKGSTPPSNATTQSAVVIGTAPAQPTGDPPGTTPVAPSTTEVTKHEESNSKPQEGDNHSYSSVSELNKQKAQGVDPQQTPERKAQ